MGRGIRHQPAGRGDDGAGALIRRLLLAAALTASGAALAADGSGERAFRKCVSCHSVDAAERGLPGPNLHGILGRRAGQDGDFEYSPALATAARGGLVWDEAALDAYIADPQALVPGTSMTFHGIDDAAERAALIAYLKAKR